ncbi:MAG: aminoacyl--tRNA ligase-related protein, partial [archaeon]
MTEKEKLIGLSAKKNENFSEWFTQICGEQGADLVDIRYGVQGFVVLKPFGFKLIRRVYELLEKACEEDNHEPMLFPTVIPEKNLMLEKEHAGFTPEVFWIEKAGDKKLEQNLGLRPTGETAIYPMYALWIRSHQDLPFKAYQSRITSFRNEPVTRPFIRGREFRFFETHDVFASHLEALQQTVKDKEMMDKVLWEKLFLPFLFLKRSQQDKFLGAKNTFCADTIMPDGKRNQLSSTHDLHQNFSKPFKVVFTNKKGEKEFGFQTCWGPGIDRIVAASISIHGDDKGMVLPFTLAPTQVVIIPIIIGKDIKTDNEVRQKCIEIQDYLNLQAGVRGMLDLTNKTPGFKFNKWELMGVPLRIEIGPNEVNNKKLKIVKRADGKSVIVEEKDLVQEIKKHAKENDELIKKKAEEYFKNKVMETRKLEDLDKILNKEKKFALTPFCSIEAEGTKCINELNEKIPGAHVLG